MMEPVLEGMPEPESLRLLSHEGEVVVLVGRWVVFRVAVADTGVRGLGVGAEPVGAEGGGARGGPVVGWARLGRAPVDSRYAGAMLLHAFFDRVGARAVFAPLAGAGPVSFRSRRFDDVALLTATAVAFALG